MLPTVTNPVTKLWKHRNSYLTFAIVIFAAFACKNISPAKTDPIRIISISPVGSELVVALGLGQAIVGIDEYSKNVPGLQNKPAIGRFTDISLSALLSLQPTHVIYDKSQSHIQNRLTSFGIKTLEIQLHKTSDVVQSLHKLGNYLDSQDQASKVIAVYQRTWKNIDNAALSNQRILIVADREPEKARNIYALGPNTFLSEIITRMGGVNVLNESFGSYPKLSLASVAALQPQTILDLAADSQEEAMQAWSTVPLAQNKEGKSLRPTIVGLKRPDLANPSPHIEATVKTLTKALQLANAR